MTQPTNYHSIVLMGKIASGKGVQAEAVKQTFGGALYSNGGKVRAAVTENSPFGQKVKETYEAGLLMPEWLASYWMTHALIAQYPKERLVFEAVAKKPDEAVQFNDIHQWLNRSYIVFHLAVPDKTARERSAKRARDLVDSEAVVEKRLQEFRDFTQQSIDYFNKQGTLVELDGTQTPEQVKAEIFTHLNKP